MTISGLRPDRDHVASPEVDLSEVGVRTGDGTLAGHPLRYRAEA